MKLFLWMIGFIVVANILGAMVAIGEGIPIPTDSPGLWINFALIALLSLAWWLSREPKQKP